MSIFPTRILLAMDGSAHADLAARVAVRLANATGSEFHLVCVGEFAPLPDFAGVDGPHHPVLGAWVVDGEPAGLGIRESDGLITDNLSFFVPHTVDAR